MAKKKKRKFSKKPTYSKEEIDLFLSQNPDAHKGFLLSFEEALKATGGRIMRLDEHIQVGDSLGLGGELKPWECVHTSCFIAEHTARKDDIKKLVEHPNETVKRIASRRLSSLSSGKKETVEKG